MYKNFAVLGAVAFAHLALAHEAVEGEDLYVPKELRERVAAAAKEAGDRLATGILAHDDDGDGRVPFKFVLKTLMSRGFAQPGGGPILREEESENQTSESGTEEDEEERLMKVVRQRVAGSDRLVASLFKPGEDGLVGVEECVELFRRAFYQFAINRPASLDVDRDGQLTLQEFATGHPIRKGEAVDESGYTQSQREAFAAQDTNGDGKIGSEEWVHPAIYFAGSEISEVLAITLLFHRLDSDGDGTVSQSELVVALPDFYSSPKSIPMNESIYWIRSFPRNAYPQLRAALLSAE
ncbi:MAG: EF-hand domain-containing protein [Verrucomicrobiota bacterium]